MPIYMAKRNIERILGISVAFILLSTTAHAITINNSNNFLEKQQNNYNDLPFLIKTFTPPCDDKKDDPNGFSAWTHAKKNTGVIEGFSEAGTESNTPMSRTEGWLSFRYNADRETSVWYAWYYLHIKVDVARNFLWNSGKCTVKLFCNDKTFCSIDFRPGDKDIHIDEDKKCFVQVYKVLEKNDEISFKYGMKLYAKADADGFVSATAKITLNRIEIFGNRAPDAPTKPNGPTRIMIGLKVYTYTTTCSDPDNNDQLRTYEWDWNGDKKPDQTTSSPKIEKVFHDLTKYHLSVRAVDGAEPGVDLKSEWSKTLEITCLSRSHINFRFFNFDKLFFI